MRLSLRLIHRTFLVPCCSPSTPSAIADITATKYWHEPPTRACLASSLLAPLTSPCQGRATLPSLRKRCIITSANFLESVSISADSFSKSSSRMSNIKSILLDLQSLSKVMASSSSKLNRPNVACLNLILKAIGNSITNGLSLIQVTIFFSSSSYALRCSRVSSR